MNDSFDWLFGIDGGGSSARLRAESLDGTRVFECSAGSTNLQSNSREAVRAALHELFAALSATGAFERTRCVAGFCGSAGADRTAERSVLADMLTDLAGRHCIIRVGNDAEAALAGALRSDEGYLLIAGTGSIALARSRDGSMYRVGGWGHWLGDEGSAFWLAMEALKRGLHAREGRIRPSSVLDAALVFFNLSEPAQLIPMVYGRFDKRAVALFAGRLEELRRAGDWLAAALFEEAACQLAGMVRALVHETSGKLGSRLFSWHGGLLAGNAFLRGRTLDAVASACPVLDLREPLGDGAVGACWLARQLISGR